jgi:Iap family predicted aminopeptidase
MNEQQRLQLSELMKTNNTIDNTELIRKLCHSSKIRKCAHKIETIIKNNPTADIKTLDSLCIEEAHFLFMNYTSIYNKLIRNHIDISVFYFFLDKLREIEDEKLTQQEAAYDIGMLLKKMYVDPRLKDAEEQKEPDYKKGKELSWIEFKIMN